MISFGCVDQSEVISTSTYTLKFSKMVFIVDKLRESSLLLLRLQTNFYQDCKISTLDNSRNIFKEMFLQIDMINFSKQLEIQECLNSVI